MTVFDETQHPRSTSGEFATKAQSAPDVGLAVDAAEAKRAALTAEFENRQQAAGKAEEAQRHALFDLNAFEIRAVHPEAMTYLLCPDAEPGEVYVSEIRNAEGENILDEDGEEYDNLLQTLHDNFSTMRIYEDFAYEVSLDRTAESFTERVSASGELYRRSEEAFHQDAARAFSHAVTTQWPTAAVVHLDREDLEIPQIRSIEDADGGIIFHQDLVPGGVYADQFLSEGINGALVDLQDYAAVTDHVLEDNDRANNPFSVARWS